MVKLSFVAAVASLLLASAAQAEPLLIKPSEADPSLAGFDAPHLIVPPSAPGAPLAVFLPGTGGRPQNAAALISVIADQGYAVIGLMYENDPAVVQVCPARSEPDCSADFRRMRLYGKAGSKVVSNTTAASIAGRLSALLIKLDHDRPGEGWGRYMKNGAPDWRWMTVSGQSQGAGMAAYLARETPVARVVLFSSPWDYVDPNRQLAPWIAGPGATPPERWFAAYNQREKTADLLAESYRRLNIPSDHVVVFTLDLPVGVDLSKSDNPFHAAGIRDVRYAERWRFLYGQASMIAPTSD